MRDTNIFNSWLELDCFAMDIAEGWIKYRQSCNKEVNIDDFLDWVSCDLCPALECGFSDVYEEEFDEEDNE